jgi:hypothetical protein
MERRLIKEIAPNRDENRLVVEVYDVLHKDSLSTVGVGYSIVSRLHGDRWWVNVHPAELDELISMLVQARREGMARLEEIKNEP